MTGSTSDHESDEIIARFMSEFDASADKAAVVEAFCAAYPALAERFRRHLASHNQLAAAPVPPPPPVPRLEPGEVLGDFRVARFLKSGGMGEIYEAEQLVLDRRRVAVKVIRNGKVSPRSRARFLREQKALARLHQTNIVPVFAGGVGKVPNDSSSRTPA